MTPGRDGVAPVRENQSLDSRSIGLARLLNRLTRRSVVDKSYLVHIPGVYGARKALCNQLTRLPGGKRFELSETLVQQLAARFAHSNRELAAEFDLPLAQYGYPLPAFSLIEGGRVERPVSERQAARQIA